MPQQQMIFLELLNVDVAVIQEDDRGQVIGVRIGLTVEHAQRLLDELGAVLHPWRSQVEHLAPAVCPTWNWN